MVGNKGDNDANSRAQQDTAVHVVDLGVLEAKEPGPHKDKQPAPLDRRRLLLGGLLMAGIFGGLTLLPSLNDGPPPEAAVPPVEVAVPACRAVQQAEEQEAVRKEGDENQPSTRILPPGYSVTGVMTSHDSTSFIGVLHPDGSLEICEKSASTAPFSVRFATEAELGELPDDMTYAYDGMSSFTDNTLTLKLQGVRLTDGSIVESVTLPDGRTVPAAEPPSGSTGR